MRYPLLLSFLMLFVSANLFSQETKVLKPTKVVKATYFDKTKPLRDISPITPGLRTREWKNDVIFNKTGMPGNRKIDVKDQPKFDPLRQYLDGSKGNPVIIENFEGTGNIAGVMPPDTDGDVGPNHYMQMINLSFAIWDKDGNLLYGPADNSTIWDGFIGPWTGTNDGDPIVLYDEMADRWMASQFALNTNDGTQWELVAISETGDPLGAWYRYAFQFTYMPDYPKLGVWHDAYYLSINQFDQNNNYAWQGAGAAALERDKMLAGDPSAQMVFFSFSPSAEPSSFLPADVDGIAPPDQEPNYFAYMYDNPDKIVIYEMDVDWNNTSNSTFSQSASIPVSSFSSNVTGIPQPGPWLTAPDLDAIASRLMFRLQYRNFGQYQAMVTNHTVDVGGGVAGVRWYEFRNSGSGWSLFQEGTYSPDNESRWMGSIAMDTYGNIALGYSVSSDNVYPSIRFTGRAVDDPLGVMTVPEQEIVAGGGYQSGFFFQNGRWGDYSMMSVDPVDGKTFWYTQEYMQSSGSYWNTRIASFDLGIEQTLTLDLKAFIEGPFNGSEMTTLLNPDHIPLTQPYNATPWNYSGTENVASMPNGDVVDWILVELRDSPDANSATSATMIAQQAAFLLKDGSIVSTDGTSNLLFDGAVNDNLYVVLYHRNHLGIMSAQAVTETGGIYTYDFSDGPAKVYGGINAHKMIGSNIYGMISADGDADGQVGNGDKNVVWNPQAGLSGYNSGDFNLDSQVDNTDKNIQWIPNGGSGSQIPQ